MYQVLYSKEALRALRKIPGNIAKTIQAKLARLAQDPYASYANVTKMQGCDQYRLRVGDWRVIYEIEDARVMIYIIRVDVRGNVYKK